MAQIINMENAGDIFPCDVCGKTDIGHAMEEAFIPAWAWKGRPAGYDDPEIDHSGFELDCLVDHGAGLGHGIVCRGCYHALYGSQGPQCFPFERRQEYAKKMLRRHGVIRKTQKAADS